MSQNWCNRLMIHIALSHLSFGSSEPIISLQKGQTRWQGQKLIYPIMNVKDQVLGNIFGWTFPYSFRQNLSLHPHSQDILQSTPCQIWDFLSSCWGCLLWPCSLKFVYPMINLAFLGIIKLNFLQNFSCSFEWFLSPNK